ncbi:MAG: BatA domain-containing protein [Flavobacteriales bacterium]|nr:BatA domain-containing protein [Flavobacteriales bacterium]
MKFAYPEFLYALFAIAIPIIIHLFNFRKFKKIYFSNVEFLKEVQQETQSKSKLKHLLILLSRILAITFLVFAFAQPFIPSSDSDVANQNNIVGIYIDNSFSMESTGENGSLLNEAKTKAIEVANSYRATDKFILITNNFNAGDQRLLSNEELIDKIEEVTISSNSRKLSTIYSRNRDAINASEIDNKSFYLLSDFQKSTADFKNIKADTLINSYIIPIKASEVSNLYIDSCWFNSPTHLLHQSEELSIRIKNNSENDLENIPIKLFINNQNVVPASFSVGANDETIITLNYRNKTNGIQQGRVELRDSPVITDDIFYFSYSISENINILGIGKQENKTALSSIYSTDSVFNYSNYNVTQLDYSIIKKSNLVVMYNLDKVNSGLSNALKSFIDNGGSLLIFPSNTINYDSYREFLSLLSVNYFTTIDTTKNKVREINLKHPVFANVFDGKPKGNLNLPIVSSHYLISKGTTAFKNSILTLKDGNPFLTEYKVGKGSIYLSTVSLDKENSNFTNHALFVPTLYNIALLSQKNYPLFHIIGSNSTIDLNRGEKDNVYHIKNNSIDIIPRVRNANNNTTVFVNSEIEIADNYTLENDKTKIGLAYNYNRSESELTYLSSTEIDEIISSSSINAQYIDLTNGTIQTALSDLNIGEKYWKYCIILALLFLAVEIVLIKIFKQ